MSRAEKFIDDCTRDCSNIFEGYCPNGKQSYFPWIHPKQARKAVEIAREEIYEWLNSHNDYIVVNGSITRFDMEKCIKDLKQAMKDE